MTPGDESKPTEQKFPTKFQFSSLAFANTTSISKSSSCVVRPLALLSVLQLDFSHCHISEP